MKIIFLTIITLHLAMAGLGQSTTTGNLQNAGQTNYLGYSNNFTLFTRTAGINRMVLMGTNPAGSITGALGLGTILPLSYLHVANFTNVGGSNAGGRLFRTDGLAGIVNQWQFFTGTTSANATQKFRVFTTIDGVSTPTDPAADITISSQNITLEASQRDMIFNAGGNVERMRILGQNHNLNGITPWFATALAGNVGIGTSHPLSMLQIGGEAGSGAGWRPWMTIGTQYASQFGFDNMYVGLRSIGIDANEAIINWGNNPSNAPTNADRLRFVFTAAPGNGIASSNDGLESGPTTPEMEEWELVISLRQTWTHKIHLKSDLPQDHLILVYLEERVD